MLQTEVRRPRPEVDALLRQSSKTGLASNFKATSALGKKIQGIKVINFNPDIAICRVFTPSAKVNQKGPQTMSGLGSFKKGNIGIGKDKAWDKTTSYLPTFKTEIDLS